MLYKYDKKQLVFKSIKFKTYLKVVGVIAGLMFMTSYITYHYGVSRSMMKLNDYEKIVLIQKYDEFNQDKLVSMMKGLNVKYPWIPMAQSIVETGHWKSHIFVENNNLFGMKEAKQRVTTAEGTQNNHAYYNHWRESVYDYAFYQSRYLGGIRTEAEYFDYLGASYAENTQYIKVLKETIERYNLKELFAK